MDDEIRRQIELYLHRLEHLVGEGRRLLQALSADASDRRELERLRVWQQECAATVGQLSGGSKAHWLSRAYSEAFLAADIGGRADGSVAAEAEVDQIVVRIVGVLNSAAGSLVALKQGQILPRASATGGRFDFVADAHLRAHLEQANVDRAAAFAAGDYRVALVGACSIIEALVTEVLTRIPQDKLRLHGGAEPPIGTWAFEARLQVAERARVISAGWRRLTPAARGYRALLDEDGDLRASAIVAERDAKIAGQVLHVLLSDLANGR